MDRRRMIMAGFGALAAVISTAEGHRGTRDGSWVIPISRRVRRPGRLGPRSVEVGGVEPPHTDQEPDGV